MAAAATAALNIQRVTTLLSPGADDTLQAIKKKLFFLLAYCDTYHDFSNDRPVKGEGKSVSKSDVGMHRSDYVKWMIRAMEGAQAEQFVRLIGELRPARGLTFENNVGREFSSLPASYILNEFPGPTTDAERAAAQENGGANDMTDRGKIRNYLYKIHSLPPGSNQQYQCLKKEHFAAIPEAKSSLIEINIPAANYSTGTVPANLIAFLQAVFPQCRDGEVLKFVEDAASFPRELFTGRLGQFRKIVTTQTKWDPAGLSLSQFEANMARSVHNVMAPSFLAAEGSTAAIAPAALLLNYFNQGNDTLIRPGEAPRNITKAGPSVNHLFMHMIIEKEGLPELTKNKYKQMIKVSKLDSKKNLVETAFPDAGTGNTAARGTRLRKLTTSKRTGDYENIHSAIEAGALMFTGDEPAFTYAKLNQCPAVYHINTKAAHLFKLYIPPPADPAVNARKIQENLTTGLLLKCLELRNTFGATAAFYTGFLRNLKDVVFSANIYVAGSDEVGRLLQKYFINEFRENREFFAELKNACAVYRTLNITTPEATLRTYTYEQLNQLVTQEAALVAGIQGRNQDLISKMEMIKRKIPSRFTGSPSSPADFNLFREFTAGESGEAFLHNFMPKPVGSPQNSGKYHIEPGTFFPEYKYIENNFEGIARYLRINARTENAVLRAKNNRIIQEVLDDFGIASIPGEGTLADDIRSVRDEIEALVAPVGGRIHRNTATQVKRRSNSKTRTAKNHTSAQYYNTLHSKISRLPASDVPFDFTPSEYADILVYRIMINNCIHTINMREGHSKLIAPMETIRIPEQEDILISKYPEYQDMPQEIQSGGALSDHRELHEYCVYLYTNSIEPFLRKHLFTDRINIAEAGGAGGAGARYTPEIVHHNILLSIVGGSYFEDLEVLLGDIVGSPEFAYLGRHGSAHLFNGMIDIANIAITGIFTKIQTSYGTPTYFIKLASHEGAVPGGIQVNLQRDIIDVYTAYMNKLTYDDTFFTYVTNICSFLLNIILHDKTAVIPREEIEPKLNDIIDKLHIGDAPLSTETVRALWPHLQNYMKYAINDYMDFGNFGGGGEAPARGAAAEPGGGAAGHGGSFKIKPRVQRRKRNGSPRRKSLRRK
jgi:hypothetical protein